MLQPIVIRGGGDLASGIIVRLNRAGYATIVLESKQPTTIRRKVAFSEAVFEKVASVEGMTGILVRSLEEALDKVVSGKPVILVDENCECLEHYHPDILIDAIIAKKNLGTNLTMASLTIALGPGFAAGVDVDYVVETQRGHDLGRIIEEGYAAKNTGVPGIIGGYGIERVIHAPVAGLFKSCAKIGDYVTEGQIIGTITDEKSGKETDVPASISGILRGIIRDDMFLFKGLKMADIDPRKEEQKNCFTISDKARCLAGSVLELVVAYEHRHEQKKKQMSK
ncbi:MAG: selenium-dependent molybdenum cofactor biosynthesis protein YqeB [Lachnospiraceae bacterium]|nr:selenium-dependent molybdenum cofactor biosynthesis protein YqeB [Lachnospiraceae bacterium]MDD3615690.1 selenium-dependent molybdenum cofactor biosynthesis protein YqeB [Lachnospiraceae bacterium]